MNNETKEMAYNAIIRLRSIKEEYDDDPEAAHILADDVLCDLLIDLGYDLVVSEYNGITKYYA